LKIENENLEFKSTSTPKQKRNPKSYSSKIPLITLIDNTSTPRTKSRNKCFVSKEDIVDFSDYIPG